jgi:phosphatidylglycerophosphate synthase
VSARTSRPSIAELRAATQPPSIFARNSGEHWAGRLYVRRLSPYLTRLLIPTPLTPNAVTWLMLLAGVLAGLALTLPVPGIVAALLAVLMIQLQILLDCSDGELARWRGVSSPVGIYLDRLAHWVTETALPIGLAIRADGGWDSLGGWTTLGLVAAVLQLFVKGESALVHVARMESGKPPAEDSVAVAAPTVSGLARLRRAAGRLPFYRAFVAMEFTLLVLAAELAGLTDELLVALVAVGAITALGHAAAILTSDRLR